MRLKMIE
jgi:hypothetical protein